MMTAADIAEVAGDQAAPDAEAWMQREGIAPGAMATMLEAVERRYVRAVAAGDGDGTVLDIAGQAFRLGWEAAKYAGKVNG